MDRIVQGNLNRSKTADMLLPQIADEHDADILILCEPYRRRTTQTYITNETETTAIWVRGAAQSRVSNRGAGDDFVWAKVGAVTYVSVYLTPNCTAAELERKVALLEDGIRDLPGNVIVAGDFNARAIEWGMTKTNRRGRLLLEMAARLDLAVVNTGHTPTYRRPGVGDSIPDVTLTSDGILPRLRGWRVIEDYTASDHQYITFEVAGQTETRRTRDHQPPRWNLDKLDGRKFSEELMAAPAPMTKIPPELTGRRRAERLTDETAKLIDGLCNNTMPKRRHRQNRRPQYWWTDEIAELRRICLANRRRVTRAGGGPERENLQAIYKTARKTLTKAIRDSKTRCWRKLCEEVNEDPWGTGYKIVTGKLGARVPPELKDAETAGRIVDGLFPTHPIRTNVTDDADVPPVFVAEELTRATNAMKTGKAPGPDGVPAEILRLVACLRPEILLDLYNTCLTTGTFSDRWKEAGLVLIPKSKGDPNTPSAYRPLSLLDTTGKLFEQLLRPRLTDAMQAGGGLSDLQFGFRRGRSTIGAIQKVVDSFLELDRHCHAARPVVLLATLDIRNAFNSARWVDILEALKSNFGIPSYLVRVVEDYLKNRRITYETIEGRVTRQVTAGVAQGSILGPDFWNGLYDGLLRLEMPLGVLLVAYADDVAAVITERSPELAQLALNQTMRRVGRWMTDHGLQLATEKTELMFLTRRRIQTILPMRVGTHETETKGEVKYLGVTLDTKMTFWPHIQRTARRAADRIASLSRLMANTTGPRPGKRRLLMATAHSILLYGAEIWADSLKTKKYGKTMTMVQRQGALRIACSYRTVSAQAVLVVAGVIPVDLLAFERKRIYGSSADIGRKNAAIAEREMTMENWQRRWTEERSGNWTRRLIRDLRPWLERKFGDVNFYVTQLLTGHGYFRRYLHIMNRVRSPDCKYCGHERDDAEHTFFVCDRWTRLRRELETTVSSITPENIVGVMLQRTEWWRLVATYTETILRRKNADGCLMDD